MTIVIVCIPTFILFARWTGEEEATNLIGPFASHEATGMNIHMQAKISN